MEFHRSPEGKHVRSEKPGGPVGGKQAAPEPMTTTRERRLALGGGKVGKFRRGEGFVKKASVAGKLPAWGGGSASSCQLLALDDR